VFDLVVLGGTVLDGTGAVALRAGGGLSDGLSGELSGGRIAAVGPLGGAPCTVIDATGQGR
jgi:hypothetical protein